MNKVYGMDCDLLNAVKPSAIDSTFAVGDPVVYSEGEEDCLGVVVEAFPLEVLWNDLVEPCHEDARTLRLANDDEVDKQERINLC